VGRIFLRWHMVERTKISALDKARLFFDKTRQKMVCETEHFSHRLSLCCAKLQTTAHFQYSLFQSAFTHDEGGRRLPVRAFRRQYWSAASGAPFLVSTCKLRASLRAGTEPGLLQTRAYSVPTQPIGVNCPTTRFVPTAPRLATSHQRRAYPSRTMPEQVRRAARPNPQAPAKRTKYRARW
jgi:hypothetical protein